MEDLVPCTIKYVSIYRVLPDTLGPTSVVVLIAPTVGKQFETNKKELEQVEPEILEG